MEETILQESIRALFIMTLLRIMYIKHTIIYFICHTGNSHALGLSECWGQLPASAKLAAAPMPSPLQGERAGYCARHHYDYACMR